MKRYDNGEVITKERIEDESWYPDYQRVIEMSLHHFEVQELYDAFLSDYRDSMKKSYGDSLQVLRWCVLQCERSRQEQKILLEG